ncbi:Hypothetical predicted protein [Cloeon dipterum]|uniref:Uncharacterized protein n=1 Tax=Cloeon dipterum TaxID=197152 RepID=A0A8S1CSF9_9INSE|nr:Hypothetical predicted protein [Cloeon dipterum]
MDYVFCSSFVFYFVRLPTGRLCSLPGLPLAGSWRQLPPAPTAVSSEQSRNQQEHSKKHKNERSTQLNNVQM